MLTEVSFIVPRNWKPSKCPARTEQMQVCTHNGWDSAIKKDAPLTHDMDESQTPRAKRKKLVSKDHIRCDSLYMICSGSDKTIRTKLRSVVARCWGWREGLNTKGNRELSQAMEVGDFLFMKVVTWLYTLLKFLEVYM